MKKADVILSEYARKLSDEDLGYVARLYSQNLQGDLGEVTQVVSRDSSVDRVLTSAVSADEFFELVDQVGKYVKEEQSRRNNTGGE